MSANIIHSIADVQHRSKSNKKVDQVKLDQLIMQLREERCKLQRRLARGSHINPESSCTYPEDNIPNLSIPDLDNEERGNILHQMAQIDAAIRQIKEGRFGYCKGCGKKLIPRTRNVIPRLYCRQCLSIIEK